MEESLGSLYERGGYSSDYLQSVYDVLSYIDNISPEERQYASKLISEEFQSISSRIRKEDREIEQEAKVVEDVESQEEQERGGVMQEIKRTSSEIQYGYVTRVNLQLLKEFGDGAWDHQVKKLRDLKHALQEEHNELKKTMKQISLNRKRRQLEFRDSRLGPLLDDLRRLQSENDSLARLLVQAGRESEINRK